VRPSSNIAPLTSVRGTLLTSSIGTLRARHHSDAYVKHLAPAYRDAVLGAIAGTWVPIEVGVAHYEACEALRLGPAEQVLMGVEVSTRIQATFLGTLTKLITGAGATPWTGLTHVERLWDRVAIGGGARYEALGPKEARIEVRCAPLARIPYFRIAFRGIIQAGCELLCKKAYVRDVPEFCTSAMVGYRLAWV
jgi:hypothetical protein